MLSAFAAVQLYSARHLDTMRKRIALLSPRIPA
jgi:hypothetical protein